MAVSCATAVKGFTELLTRCNRITTCVVLHKRRLHLTTPKHDKLYNPEDDYKTKFQATKGWLDYNDVVYEPTKEGEPMKPAEICHQRDFIPCSAKKFWYATCLVRGLSIDEAIKQCEFSKTGSAKVIKDVLLEAQEMAIIDFNVEFESNLWVADSFARDKMSLKGIRRHAFRRVTALQIKYCTYFLRLREGQPPKHYYPCPQSGNEKLEEYIRGQRQRRIANSL